MSTGTFPISLVTLDAAELPGPATDTVTYLLAAAGLPVGTVRVIKQNGRVSAEQVLLGEIDDHLESYVAEAWSDYKAKLREVTVAGGVDGAPVPFHARSPLCRLDEEAVALACDAWRQAFALGMSLARTLATGGVAVRLPATELCPSCGGSRVDKSDAGVMDDRDCPRCDGDGVVEVTPDLLVLGGAAGAMPLPVQIVRT